MDRMQSMRITFASTAMGVALLLDSGAARAASRVTPPFSVPIFNGSMVCTVVNLSGAARTITIEVRDSQGNLVPSANCSANNPKSDPVNAGAIEAIGCTGSGNRYCRFTAKGGKATFRGVLRVMDGNNATIAVLPAE